MTPCTRGCGGRRFPGRVLVRKCLAEVAWRDFWGVDICINLNCRVCFGGWGLCSHLCPVMAKKMGSAASKCRAPYCLTFAINLHTHTRARAFRVKLWEDRRRFPFARLEFSGRHSKHSIGCVKFPTIAFTSPHTEGWCSTLLGFEPAPSQNIHLRKGRQ